MSDAHGRPLVRPGGREDKDQRAPVLRLSVFDRLADEDVPFLEAMRLGIRADLEMLLNTDRRVVGWAAELNELDSSILNFGMMNFATTNLATDQRRASVVNQVGDIIRRWEPRLGNLRVTALPNIDATDRSLRIRIEAEIMVDPNPEPMVFDTVIDPIGNTVSLSGGRRE